MREIARLSSAPLVFIDQEADMAGLAEAVEQGLRNEQLDPGAIGRSIARVRARKALLA